jgi:hypothetical protein
MHREEEEILTVQGRRRKLKPEQEDILHTELKMNITIHEISSISQHESGLSRSYSLCLVFGRFALPYTTLYFIHHRVAIKKGRLSERRKERED